MQVGVVDNTEVTQFDLYPGLHSLTIYFTLSDAYARGFVRPICISYLTVHRRKLEEYHNEIRNKVQKVTYMGGVHYL